MDRRGFITGLASGAGASLLAGCAEPSLENYPLAKTRAEWKALLPNNNYRVLFEEVTEFAYSSELNDEKRPGTYICYACHVPLFDSATKYDSETGWPSFYDAQAGSIQERNDFSFFLLAIRTEYHCSRCGGHQGHIFHDGPAPTFLRHCNNGLALRFIPKGEKLPALRK